MSALGALPTSTELVAERFFDDSGGMQLVVHAPLGARVNRAWGLALRKSFCRSFDFELQAAATDDAVLLSLGPQHSFPLETIFDFVRSTVARHVLEQAILQSPMWETRWRWNATRSLAVLRHQGGKRLPPQLLRMKANDLLAAVFPMQVGCQDNHAGAELELPDHPLVKETMDDCLHDAMDVDGLVRLLEALETKTITITARDTTAPSVFAHAILNANPYAFLDDAPLEERRSRSVQLGPRPARGASGLREADHLSIDPSVIETIVAEAAPQPRDPDELHDLLLTVGLWRAEARWAPLFEALRRSKRAVEVDVSMPADFWAATERVPLVRVAYPAALVRDDVSAELAMLGDRVALFDAESACTLLVGARLRLVGPRTAAELASELVLRESDIAIALARLEADGQVLQGRFRWPHAEADSPHEFCERGLLQRMHRRTLGRRRSQIRAVSQQDLYRFLLRWQHVAPGTQVHGIEGLRHVIEQLEGLEVQAVAWERDILQQRIADYDPAWLDELCLSGEVAWGRLRLAPPDPDRAPRRHAGAYGPSGAISLFLREHGDWLVSPALDEGSTAPSTWPGLSALARRVAEHFERRGAAFLSELQGLARGLAATDQVQLVDDALWELVRHGVVASDGFDGLRALIGRRRSKAPARSIGRWSAVHRDARPRGEEAGALGDGSPTEHAWLYLRRYGIVTRDLLTREPLSPPWRALVDTYRRLEARGEIRGGRFVTGLVGEQFALPDALEQLERLPRIVDGVPQVVSVAASDPLNLAGILSPGPRRSVLSSERVFLDDGVPRKPAEVATPAAALAVVDTLSA